MAPVNLPKPSVALVKDYIKKFDNDNSSNNDDKKIEELINKFPENKKVEEILQKVKLINSLYKTRMPNAPAMAKHIQALQIDKALNNGDYTIVNKIAICKLKDKVINSYSFATKYCSFHNWNKFPIFDSLASKILTAYNKEDQYVEKMDLKDYPTLVNVIKAFQERHGLQQFSFKEIDKFLWILGKEYFKKP